MGLTRTFQSLELFEDLTVRDNLMAAAERSRWFSFAADILFPGRGERRLSRAGRLGVVDPEAVRLRRSPAQRPQPWSAQAGRRCPSSGRAAQAGAARRTCRRLGHDREPVAGQSPARLPRARHEPVPDRPRHGPGAERVRLHLRPRLRTGDRPRHASAGARRSGGDRRVPGRVGRRSAGAPGCRTFGHGGEGQ